MQFILILFVSFLGQLSFSATTTASGKSTAGYDTMDMGQFKELTAAAARTSFKFQANCTMPSGELISSTDSRFTDCMNHAVIESKMHKESDTKAY